VLRIAQVAAVVTPSGAFGGPIRVAVNQTRELRAQGHDVALFAGMHGFDRQPSQIDGVDVRLFPTIQMVPGSGFLGRASISMLRELRAELRGFDVAHIHVGRDLLTLPAAALADWTGVPYILQSHGMIVESHHRFARPLDALATRRILRRASSVLFLTEAERDGLSTAIDPSLPFENVVNGVPRSMLGPPARTGIEVLFMARLQRRKRPLEFVEAAAQVASRHPDVTFALVGPDEGLGRQVSDRIHSSTVSQRVRWEGALSSDLTAERMSRAAIYVLPSVDEPFPMSVLEAMSLGLPVVVTDSCGLADVIAASGAGLVVAPSQQALNDGIELLVADAHLRRRLGDNGLDLVKNQFSMEAVGHRLVSIYENATRGVTQSAS
jgi:glycosyltransferase involved in cell wall biosynthesis